MIALERLVMLAAGELEEADSASVEEHVLSCGACATTLERLLAMGSVVPEVVRRGGVGFPVTPALGEQLERAGLISRSYRIRPGAVVPCSVGAEDIYAMTTLEADLDDVERVDLVLTFPFGVLRMDDVPFDARQGVVAYVARSSELRMLPSTRVAIELRAHDAHGERTAGPYFLDHTGFTR